MIKQLLCFLLKIELFILGGAIIVSIFYEPFLPYSIALAFFWGGLHWIIRIPPNRSTPLNLPVLLFLPIMAVSLCITPLPDNTFLQVFRLLNGILFFFCLLNSVSSLQSIDRVMKFLGVLGLLLAGSSLLLVNWNEKFKSLSALTSEMISIPKFSGVHPNVMGGTIVLLLVGICAFLVFRWKSLRSLQRIGLGFIIFFMFVILILTQSRGALIALVAALISLVLLRFRYGWIPVLLGTIIVSGLIFWAGPEKIWHLVGTETGGVTTIVTREQIWQRARLMLQDFPLTGIGMGTFGDVLDHLYPLTAKPGQIPHAHNLFLQIGVDLGIPGLIAWLVCWFTIITMAWQLYRHENNTLRTLGAAVLCSQIAMGVHGMLDCVTWDTRPAVIVWAIWGLTATAWLQLRSVSPAAIPAIEKPPASDLFPPIRSHSKITP